MVGKRFGPPPKRGPTPQGFKNGKDIKNPKLATDTAKKIIKMIYDAGAKEVHLGIACPPIKHPDFYGIDTPDYNELIASKNSIEEISKTIGSKSLFFLSLEGTYQAMGYDSRNPDQPQFTDHCFTGEYPTSLIDREKGNISKQFSLLTEKN